MAEIFYNGKIYVGALSKHEYENVFNEGSDKLWVDYLNEIPDIRKYPVTGTHSFKDGQDVTRLYKLEHQLRSYNPDKEEWYKPAYLEDFHTATAGKRIVAIPATPPDELDREAQYDWEKEFYRRMEINGYKRAEYIPEISDSVELFREFIQLGYFSTPTSNKR